MSAPIKPGEMNEDRMDRSRRISWMDLDAIAGSHCLVVGAGALGNEVVKNLVLSGVRRITLVDMDEVVRSNLNRCVFFREEDAGRRASKAETVAQRARDLYQGIEIVPLVSRIEEVNLQKLGSIDVTLGCLDNVAARLHLNSHAYHLGIPCIDGGTHGFSGRVQVVIPPETPCVQCGMNRTHFEILEMRYSCTGRETSFYEPRIPAEITTTSVIAAIQVREALKILSGMKDRCLRNVMYYNGVTGTAETLELTVDPHCPLHN